MIDTEEFQLVTGKYYRFNVTSSGETDWRLELPELLANSHLRILTVDDGIEIHLQAMTFRAVEFDEPGLRHEHCGVIVPVMVVGLLHS